MDPRVRDLYKRFMLAGRSYPLGISTVRNKVKDGFLKNKDITSEVQYSLN